MDYIFNKLADTALQFNRQLESELKIQKEHLEDRNRKLESEIKEVKEQLTKQLNQKSELSSNLEQKLAGLEKEKQQLG